MNGTSDADNARAEYQWGAAINRWFERDPSALSALIRNSSLHIPDYAREFLADLADGKVSRGKGGRPVERHGWVERSIVAEVFREWDAAEALAPGVHGAHRDSPKDAACKAVAERRGNDPTEDAVRGLVDKLRKVGFTREGWRTWGRPDFKNR